MIQDVHRWSESVFGGCNLGDTRLTRRLVKTASCFAIAPEASVNAAFNGDRAAQEGG